MRFLDGVLESGRIVKDEIALCSNEDRMTYGELYAVSGSIYAWLKKQGIGKDKVVVINLPRGINTIAAVIGVWRAGAAVCVCETVIPPQRVELIKQDVSCALTINSENLTEAMACDGIDGREDIDEHDIAFVVYTSGSTGAPKGVMHEFGKLDIILEVDSNTDYDHVRQIVGCIAPLSTVVNMLLLVPALANRGVLDIIPYAILKDPAQMLHYISTHSISMMFMPPDYLKSLNALPALPSSLKVIFIGSARAEDAYRNGIRVLNGYASSESGFTALYHTTRMGEGNNPVGKSVIGLKAYIDSPENGIGELVIENPYTRGYVNSALDEGVFENGMLYTGDMASVNAEGDIVIRGRRDNMIKIRGNRIDPSEIEGTFNRITGLDWSVAVGINDGSNQYVCLYYTGDNGFDAYAVKREMAQTLPDYMLPTRFMYLETVPLLPNGKLDRKALPKPSLDDNLTAYVPPETELELKLCEAFSKVLGIENVGVNDDFCNLGGDSLTAVSLLSEVGVDIPLDVLLNERTPGRIAAWAMEYLEKLPDKEELDRLNEEAKYRPHPLTAMQRYVLRFQMYTPQSTMWNLPLLMSFDLKRITADKMCSLIKKLLAVHPSLSTTILLNSEGFLEQRWAPELMGNIEVEHISEAQFAKMRDELVYPFAFGEVALCRCRIFETEKSGYLFIDMHHSMTDGYSIRNLKRDFVRLIKGEELPTDYYFLNVENELAQKDGPVYKEAQEYFSSMYSGDNWARYPVADHDSRSNLHGSLEMQVPLKRQELEELKRYYGVTSNELCMAAFLLAIARYNHCTDVHGVWTYNGRNDLMHKDTVGLMFRMMPVALHFRDGMPVSEVFADLREQFRRCIVYNCYPFALDMFDPVSQDRASCFFQSDIYDSSDLVELGVQSLDINDRYGASCGILDMSCIEDETGLALHVDYDASRYEKSSIRRFTSYVSANIASMFRKKWSVIELEN